MGCLIGGLIQRGGGTVSFFARGTQLDALRQHGLTLESDDDRWSAPVHISDSVHELGQQDALLLCTKSYQLPKVAAQLAPLLHDQTIIVPTVNGIPWWYFYQQGGPYDGRRLTSLDPDGLLAQNIDNRRIIGCVNYLAGTLVRPGVVHYVPELKRRLAIGEPGGEITPRLQALGDALALGGFEPIITESIRTSIWHKLWGNIAFNPISALTHGTIDQIAEGYRDIDLLSAVMNEARFVADKLGVELSQTTQSRVAAAAKMRGHKTSMLQDMEQGRATEIEAIVGVVREISHWLEISTPYLNALYSLVKLKEIFYLRAASGIGQV